MAGISTRVSVQRTEMGFLRCSAGIDSTASKISDASPSADGCLSLPPLRESPYSEKRLDCAHLSTTVSLQSAIFAAIVISRVNLYRIGRKRKRVVGLGRFELPTYGLGNRCSIHLSYRPARKLRSAIVQRLTLPARACPQGEAALGIMALRFLGEGVCTSQARPL